MSQKITKQSRKPGSNRVGTNLFGKGQRIITDTYRKEYDRIFKKRGVKNK